MANEIKFEEMHERPEGCMVCEAMLPDAVDGLLSEAEQRAFDRHVAGCVACAAEFAEAQRGAAWLGMLKGHAPEPPAGLLARIMAETTGAGEAQSFASAAVALPSTAPATPAWSLPAVAKTVSQSLAGGHVAGWRKRLVAVFSIEHARATFQPRLAMTAAMAFFSLALTLNLSGARLSDIRASNFTPSGMRRSVVEASASATRSFQNLRVVYQMESRVNDLRGDGPFGDNDRRPEPKAPAQPGPETKQPKDQPRGSSELVVPISPRNAAALAGKDI